MGQYCNWRVHRPCRGPFRPGPTCRALCRSSTAPQRSAHKRMPLSVSFSARHEKPSTFEPFLDPPRAVKERRAARPDPSAVLVRSNLGTARITERPPARFTTLVRTLRSRPCTWQFSYDLGSFAEDAPLFEFMQRCNLFHASGI